MTGRRLKELFGMFMIGEGVTGVLAPTRHSRLWRVGPRKLQNVTRYFEERPKLTAALAAAEIGFGVWLVTRQLRR